MLDLKVMESMFALIRTVIGQNESLDDDDRAIIRDNIEQIYVVSERCDMAHLVGYALEKAELISPENEFFAKFQEEQYLSIVRSERMIFELDRICNTFEKNKIKHIPLKGAVIRNMYPESWMRTSSDIDVLVHKEDLEAAKKCLVEELKYRTAQEGPHDHSLFTPEELHIEVHFDLIEEGIAKSSREVLNNVWDYAKLVGGTEYKYELSDGMFYFYHIAHLAKHMSAAGMGMRPFLDVWIINKTSTKNVEERGRLLSMCELNRFSSLCEEVSEHWFGGSDNASESARKLELFVLNCGTYGSFENRITTLNNGGGTAQFIRRRIFLSCEALCSMYPSLKKHKWLMPIYQVRRWCKLFSVRMFKKAIHEVRVSNSISQKDVENMHSFLSGIGL